jgi:hypothetical protein
VGLSFPPFPTKPYQRESKMTLSRESELMLAEELPGQTALRLGTQTFIAMPQTI